MKKIIIVASFIAASAIAGTAFASVDEELHALCMQDSTNSAKNCSCTVNLVKTRMGAHDYKVLYALATGTSTEDRDKKIAEAGATAEEVQGVQQKFQAMTNDIESQCYVKIETSEKKPEN